MQQSITDKSSAPYQRLAWEALKKSINGLINKVNVSNIVSIVKELMAENIVRGRYVILEVAYKLIVDILYPVQHLLHVPCTDSSTRVW